MRIFFSYTYVTYNYRIVTVIHICNKNYLGDILIKFIDIKKLLDIEKFIKYQDYTFLENLQA